ncbi:MAG: hypothetical protein A2Y97_09560 [Nitrospirae bacterium RBG_13_39_12]|nr:MAG: hypothetical protein A2Y97_09560 [Nitrospirae bacterium RBG_13_39_12]
MNKFVAGLTVAALLAIGAIAYANGPGWYGGGHMGQVCGYDTHMMGPGYGGHMKGLKGGYDQKFLDETVDLRKELNNKRFEYFEAVRSTNTKPDIITSLEKDIRILREKLHEKAPSKAYRGAGGHGCRW